MSVVETERVLVVRTELFRKLGYFQGINRDVGTYLDHLVDPVNTSYRPRRDMEDDPSFKQLIPYVIFRYTDQSDGVLLFQYTRGKGQGEQRLHSKRSIGIGGHICSDDSAAELNPYQEGMRRELNEEVYIDTDYVQTCVGLLNDDDTDVGKVHLGVVHIFDVDSPEVRPREAEIHDASFQPVVELLNNTSGFESWSRICLETLFGSAR